MQTIGNIEIRITGKKGNLDLTPDNYDIKEIRSVLDHAEKLLFPNEKNRPLISYNLEEGSVRHILKTSMQAIIGFNAILAQVQTSNNIDFLEINTSKAIESFQEMAISKNYSFEIKTSIENTSILNINTNTAFKRSDQYWTDAEFYFYGKITNAGGKQKANIHLNTDDLGTIIITTPKTFLAESEENILYKSFGIRASGKQHSLSGEIDSSSLTFLELIDYDKKYDNDYLNSLRTKAKGWLNNISSEDWLNDLRGYDV